MRECYGEMYRRENFPWWRNTDRTYIPLVITYSGSTFNNCRNLSIIKLVTHIYFTGSGICSYFFCVFGFVFIFLLSHSCLIVISFGLFFFLQWGKFHFMCVHKKVAVSFHFINEEEIKKKPKRKHQETKKNQLNWKYIRNRIGI